MVFSTDSVRLVFAAVGKEICVNDGLIHRKAVHCMIIAQATEGKYSIECGDGRSSALKTGEAFLTAPDIPLSIAHHCDPKSGRMTIRWIHFNFNVFDAINLAALFELPLCIEKKWANLFGDIADKMFLVQNSEDAKSLKAAVRINELAFNLLYLLLEFLEGKNISPHLEPGLIRLLPVLEYARRNLGRKLVVADLAKKANLSIPRFHVEFKRLLGDSPLEYVRKMRLSKASEILRSCNASLEETAQATGFCNQFHLSREFKRCYGCPPTVYRRNFSSDLAI